MKEDKIFDTPRTRGEKFEFNQEVADVFDDMILRSVPCYQEIQRMTVEIAAEFAQPTSRIYDLGCATGTTLFLLTKAIDLPGVEFIGIDDSDAMLSKARDRLSNAALHRMPVLRNADLNGEVEISHASAVILNWTLQFVRLPNRARLIRRIFDGVLSGGCVIVIEKVVSNDPSFNSFYIKSHQGFKRRNGYTDLEIANKREALETVLIPVSVEDNIVLLQRGGFSLIDVFFRWYNFAGLIAIKR